MGFLILVMAFILHIGDSYLGVNLVPFVDYLQYALLGMASFLSLGMVVVYILFYLKYKDMSANPEKAVCSNGDAIDLKGALSESKSILIALSFSLMSVGIISYSLF